MCRSGLLVSLSVLVSSFGVIACSSDEQPAQAMPTGPDSPPTVEPMGGAGGEVGPGMSSTGTPSPGMTSPDGEGTTPGAASEGEPGALPLNPTEGGGPNPSDTPTPEPPAAEAPPVDDGPPAFVFDVENTGADCPAPPLPPLDQLPAIAALPDPFLSANGSRVTTREDWRCRRREVAAQIQNYEMGERPGRPSISSASLQGNVLTVTAGEPSGSVTLSVTINRPNGAPQGPTPAVIGVAGRTGSLPSDIFDSRGIVSMAFNVQQLAAQFPGRGDQPYNQVFGADTDAGAIIAWAWGISRIIDGLEQVPEANIDMSRIAVTGCSFAGKIALYAGAFDERIRLTIPEESGGGGTANWRVSEDERANGTDTENLSTAQGTAWYHRDLPQFNAAVDRLPFDHHQVIGMVAPRALLAIESSSTFFPRLSHVSTFTSGAAAREIWQALGVPERMGMTQVSTNHCQFPASQRDEVEAFVDRFLLDREGVDTDVLESDAITPDLARWAPWETPTIE
jgi:hypothetical protein